MGNRVMKLITVVICTYKREELLKIVLNSIQQQSMPYTKYKVLIVDNANSKSVDIEKIYNKYRKIMDIELIREVRIGLSHARNRGYNEATTQYVVYIDDDAIAHEQWLESIMICFAETSADIIGGPAFVKYGKKRPSWLEKGYGTFGYMGNERKEMTNKQYVTGVNMAYRRSLLVDLGGFRSSYGMTGDKTMLGEETDLQNRAREKYPNIKK